MSQIPSQKTSGSKKGRKPSKITAKEKEWVDLMLSAGLGPIHAARKVFNWRCEPGSSQAQKVVDLKKTQRVKDYLEECEVHITRETEAHTLFLDSDSVNWDQVRKFAFTRLKEIRDNQNVPAQTRYNAIVALEKIADPSGDVNLIFSWLDLLWRGAVAHCPRCHGSFPLWKIQNPKLEEWRLDTETSPLGKAEDVLDRRLEVLSKAEKRKKPHPGQILGLKALERDLVGMGPARSGKSFMLAQLALLSFLIPGVEIWVLARIYEDATSEVEYLKKFLNTLFYPNTSHVIKEVFDSKTGELVLTSKWGSLLKIRSGKAKGSITGRELEMALVAEPGWVDESLFEELRARMSSRLGRIVMLGTPKGFSGILGRMVNMTGRDPKTGKVIRLGRDKRTLVSGCAWNISALIYNMDAKDNPEYVKSELDAARMGLTDEEYASEFEGLMSTASGAKFPYIQPKHLVNIPREVYDRSIFVLGVDQGPKNFAAALVGWDDTRAYVAREYFASDTRTMKSHMEVLLKSVPGWIRTLGGDPDRWQLTIFDADPPLINELEEFEDEGNKWPTEVSWRPKNITGKFTPDNWRSDTYEYINSLSMGPEKNILFELQHCDLLHDQLMRAQDAPLSRARDGGQGNTKGWIIRDPWRGDHVVDAFVLAMHTILSGQVVMPDGPVNVGDPWAEAKAAFNYKLARDDQRELQGYLRKDERVGDDGLFEKNFGRRRTSKFLNGIKGYYQDES